MRLGLLNTLGIWAARTILAFILFMGVVLLSAVLFFVAVRWDENRSCYDRANADYQYVTSQIRLADGDWAPSSIDLKRINNGDWQFLCIVGGYNDPVELLGREASRRGVQPSTIDPVATKFLGLSPVEENEGAVSFVDKSGHGRTILIDGFERLAPQHGWSCYSPETTTIELPLPREE